MKNKKILLPGGAGLVGQNLVTILKKGAGILLYSTSIRQISKVLRRMQPDITIEYADLSVARFMGTAF